MKEIIQNRIINIKSSIIEALKTMEDKAIRLLLVFDECKFVGILSIGDIQRAVIKNTSLNEDISKILRTNYTFSDISDIQSSIKRKMIEQRIECMPVLDENGDLVDVILWEDLFQTQSFKHADINLPVVIMAGGKGLRLKPLTNIFPKPLIPVGEKTIVESIMDHFVSYGCHKFYLSVNYKADVIKNYFEFLANPDYKLSYFQEDKPMGTAGSLRLLRDQISSTFFVSNCDIMVNEDYASILDYHRQNKNELTVVAALKTYSIPYGTIVTGENGLLQTIEEKPNLTFKINTGLYILEPSLLNDIPNEFFHITHLMNKLKNEGRRVGVYPVSQKDWMDMGDWKEYLKMINQ
ncbi:nucleotidyltransferase family protein [Bacteroides xylanisolvens]|jgi:dTDP-glucose pyrophosphorylase|uniref:nucleotidyltransferase family protein n=1 Tax=Bacteroides xylanisolvens TaxID=371601 RepID=UPI0032C0819B